MNELSSFEQLGGESRLRAIVDAFIDRVFEDRMIGFFFRNANRARIKETEYQLIAKFLGADIEYKGKPLQTVHAQHPIMGGHFARRQQILKETLQAFHVPEAVMNSWLEHNESLRPLITAQSGSGCDPIAARQNVISGRAE